MSQTDGINMLRNSKRRRGARAAQVPPAKHPAVAPRRPEASAPQDASSAAAEPAPVVPPATAPAAPADAATEAPQSVGEGTPTAVTSASVQQVSAPVAADPVPSPAAPVAPAAAAPSRTAQRPLPDLTVDWSDPLMHTIRPTRLSVPASVLAAFKAAAEQPGQPPQTVMAMEAVSTHLARLPELVLARRPAEGPDSSTFYRQRTAPTTVKPEPAQQLYFRPLMGEDQALNRIVDWVTEIIVGDNPVRRPATRSEVVTAALAAQYLPPVKRR